MCVHIYHICIYEFVCVMYAQSVYVGIYVHVWVQRPEENKKCSALLWAGVTGIWPYLIFDMGTGI